MNLIEFAESNGGHAESENQLTSLFSTENAEKRKSTDFYLYANSGLLSCQQFIDTSPQLTAEINTLII